MTVDANSNLVDTLKIWDLKANTLELLFQRTYDSEVYCLKWYELRDPTKDF